MKTGEGSEMFQVFSANEENRNHWLQHKYT
jgi:hypothetical protein